MKPFNLNLRGKLYNYSHPLVMGIINITEDSFFSGSRAFKDNEIISKVEEMILAGADIIDIGACSTRPGSSPVTESAEIAAIGRAVSLIKPLTGEIPLSVDTYRAAVTRVAVKEGADIINDISGGDLDPNMWETIKELDVPYIIMHMRGTPANMQSLTDYDTVTADVIKELSRKLRELSLIGIKDVIIDPGFGFAKTLDQNYELLHDLNLFQEAFPGIPLLVGMSRKSMVTKLLNLTPSEALNGTTALNMIALMQGAAILRVHDVKEAKETVMIYDRFISPTIKA